MTMRKFFNRYFRRLSFSRGARSDSPDRIEAGPDLPAEDAALARDLLALALSVQPEREFVTRLDGELSRARLTARPAAQAAPSFRGQIRLLTKTTWGWALPAGAVLLLILIISLLVQMRPRPGTPSAPNPAATSLFASVAPTSAPLATAIPTPTPLDTVTPVKTTYIVMPGDTLQSIADWFNVTPDAIMQANNLTSSGEIYPGQSLIIPLPAEETLGSVVIAIDTPTPPVPATPAKTIYIVVEGDTLLGIAAYFGVTPDAIFAANHMQSGDVLRVGMSLIIPTPSLTSMAVPTPVPLGVFPLLFYPPVVLHYDPTLWIDESQYTNTEKMVNYLQSRSLDTCSLGPVGPSGYYPTPDKTVTLKYIRYQVTTLVDTPPGSTTAYYIDAGSMAEYPYAEKGAIVFTVTASQVQWQACKALAENILGSPYMGLDVMPTEIGLPKGDPVPVGFDLAHSVLTFQTIGGGDEPTRPSFLYADIYADDYYRVGRVDFGAIPGAYCQRSPDGLKLAIDHATLFSDTPTEYQLRWLALDSPADVHPLSDLQLVSSPAWGPDSSRLAFIACDANQRCGLYTYDIAAGAVKFLAAGGDSIPPVWSQDGGEIAYQGGAGGSPQTLVVDAASGVVNASPGWQPQLLADWRGRGYSQCEQPPTLAPTLPAAPADWQVYANIDYGFSFRYPAGWTLEESSNSITLKQGTLEFYIQFSTSEDAGVGSWRIAEGDFVYGGRVSFLGQSLPRFVRVYQGKVKAVYYSLGVAIPRGEVRFGFGLEDYGVDYSAVDLSAQLQQELDQVVESFTWIHAPPAQPVATPTPVSPAQALLAELQSLVAKRTNALLSSTGWVYLHLRRTNSITCGSRLPNGAFNPCEIEEHDWYELNSRGQVVTVITRQLDPSGKLFQESVTRRGLTRNLTFGFENTTTLTTTYAVDWGFAAEAAQAVADGAAFSQQDRFQESGDGFLALLLVEGDIQREAVFDPETGGLHSLSTWKQETDGFTQTDSVKLLDEQRVDQPPEDALAMLDQPLQPYQPLPPQGDPVPVGFDLAHSLLGMRNIAGDSFNSPSFWYGDLYADGPYLVGRVDFGSTPGGYCQRSPDGFKLAFDHVTLSTATPAVHQLRWLNLGSPADVHAGPPGLQLVSLPVWGLDSARLAFIACDVDQSCGLYTYEIAAGALKRLADGGNAIPPVWSPDGAEIAFRAGPSEALQTVVVDATSGRINASPAWQPQFVDLKDAQVLNQCMQPPALALTQPAAPADWLVYTNPKYGFTFRYPSDWTLEESSNSVLLTEGTLQISIGFRNLKEQASITRTGVGSGDISPDGHISFFGLSLPRDLLVYGGKLKAVLYNSAAETQRGDLVFTLSLDDFSLDYDGVNIPPELQQVADQVVESFAWIPATP